MLPIRLASTSNRWRPASRIARLFALVGIRRQRAGTPIDMACLLAVCALAAVSPDTAMAQTGTATPTITLDGSGITVAPCVGCVNITYPPVAQGVYNFGASGGATPSPNSAYQLTTIFSEPIYLGGASAEIATAGGANLIGGPISDLTIYAQVGSPGVVLQFEYYPATSSILPAEILPQPAYLILSGATALSGGAVVPVTSASVATHSREFPFYYGFGFPLTFQSCTVSLSNTPYSPPQNPVFVPNVVSLPLLGPGGALAMLTNSGLNINGPGSFGVPGLPTVTGVPSSPADAGVVLSQTPCANNIVASGSSVNLTVGSGIPGPGPAPELTYSGDGTSSFNYTLYSNGYPFGDQRCALDNAPQQPPYTTCNAAAFSEAFVGVSDSNPTECQFENCAGGYVNGNLADPVIFVMNYTDSTAPFDPSCAGLLGCAQMLNGSGQLQIIHTQQCGISPGQSSQSCNYTTGTLGGPNGPSYVIAGNSLASFGSPGVNTASFLFTYTPTASYDYTTGILTNIGGATAGSFKVNGNSDTNSNLPFGAPFGTTVPAPVPLCYVDGVGSCGAYGTSGFAGEHLAGPYFGSFGIDWKATISATPVSLTPTTDTVPNVVGQSLTTGSAAIIAAGLAVGTVGMAPSTTVGAGSIISETPSAGTSANAGSAVNLEVSSGPPPVTVPNVVGLAQSVAASNITSVGLIVGTVNTQSSPLLTTGDVVIPSGDVISQTPLAPTSVASGSAVNLVVSSGPLRGDLNLDGQVDKLDLDIILAALNKPASGPNDPRDLNHDGVISALDARILVTLCSHAGCAIN